MRRRKGDDRSLDRESVPLNLAPTHNDPMRWLPRHGNPTCLIEWLSQGTTHHRVVLYIAFVVTLTLVVQLMEWGR